MIKLILILIAVICLQGCSSFSINREIDTPFGKIDANYNSWMGTDSFKIEPLKGVEIWK